MPTQRQLSKADYAVLADAIEGVTAPRFFVTHSSGNIMFYSADRGQSKSLRPGFSVYQNVMAIINPLAVPDDVECELVEE